MNIVASDPQIGPPICLSRSTVRFLPRNFLLAAGSVMSIEGRNVPGSARCKWPMTPSGTASRDGAGPRVRDSLPNLGNRFAAPLGAALVRRVQRPSRSLNANWGLTTLCFCWGYAPKPQRPPSAVAASVPWIAVGESRFKTLTELGHRNTSVTTRQLPFDGVDDEPEPDHSETDCPGDVEGLFVQENAEEKLQARRYILHEADRRKR